MDKIQYLKRQMLIHVEAAKTAREKFKDLFDEGPISTLEWSYGMFEVQAKSKVAEELLARMESPAFDLQVFTSLLQKQVNNKARFPSFSTSPTHNLMSQYLLAAEANLLELLNDL